MVAGWIVYGSALVACIIGMRRVPWAGRRAPHGHRRRAGRAVQLFLHDDDAAQVVYSSGFIPVSAPGQHARPDQGARSSSRSSCRAGGTSRCFSSASSARSTTASRRRRRTVLFWAGKLHVDGPTNVNARLLTVPPGDDADGDYWPDADRLHGARPRGGDALRRPRATCSTATTRTRCRPAADGTPIALIAGADQPVRHRDLRRRLRRGLQRQRRRGLRRQGRRRRRPRPRLRRQRSQAPSPDRRSIPSPIRRTAAATASARSTRPTSTPTSSATRCCARCSAAATASTRAAAASSNDPKNDTTCIVDADCDGYPAPSRPGQRLRRQRSQRPPRRRRAVRLDQGLSTATAPIGEGCVPCDLDGDGFERIDADQQLPRRQRQAPGHGRLQRRRRGRLPRRDQRRPAAARAAVNASAKIAAALRGFCRGIYEPTALTGTAKINPFGGIVGDADCNGTAFEGCPALIDPGCDSTATAGRAWPCRTARTATRATSRSTATTTIRPRSRRRRSTAR